MARHGGTPDPLPDARQLARSHLDRLIDTGRANFGPDPTAMWMSSIDIRTGRYPEDDTRDQRFGKRVYRNIDAPRGCSAYWDQPLIAAAHELTRLTGERRYAEAADAYLRDFLERSLCRNDLLLWGNHYYWGAFDGCVKKFAGEETPQCVNPAEEPGERHELRPLLPDWDCLWRVDAGKTERAIRAMAIHHVFDAEAGGFNRHADRAAAHAFLEAGGILAASLAWLYAKTQDVSLADLALRIARFSWSHRHPATDLVPVSPLTKRWDRTTCTSEVGLWAGMLLRCASWTQREEFERIAAEAVAAYLRYGYDADADRYYGKLNVADGKPVLGPSDWPYMPGDYCNPWRPLFPTHDYPMQLAEACLELHCRTGEEAFGEGAARWMNIVTVHEPPPVVGAYAEHFGRCIHFASRWERAFDSMPVRARVLELAARAVDDLFTEGMFRGHSGEDRYDAVDGVGLLAWALMDLPKDGPQEYVDRMF